MSRFIEVVIFSHTKTPVKRIFNTDHIIAVDGDGNLYTARKQPPIVTNCTYDEMREKLKNGGALG